jgi:hypothetical protein
VNRSRFESRVLHLWVTTRVPLTRANLAVYTGAPREKVERWLDALCTAGVLDLDADDEGELIYRVRGAARPASGATSIGEIVKREQLEGEVDRLTRRSARKRSRDDEGGETALARIERQTSALARRAGAAAALRGGGGDRSVIASAALSFFLGPLGWLYAAPLKTAAAGIAGFLVLYWLLPAFLFTPLLGLLLPASAAAGAYFAWTRKPET